ncbi:hypothetical protein Syun_011863 [Stephania yunnanensis]|uniref:Water stress and hypersensitive response domain-containing protein n=1 Tax=Stephania yunnanensis TaxID=152371 RepID=A0AAP0PER0_9MAGN
MASPPPPPGYYTPIPPPPPDPQFYILLPLYRRRHHRLLRRLTRCLLVSSAVALLLTAAFLLWPSDPRLKIVRASINHLHVRTKPSLSLDLSLALTIQVRNPDFFSLHYNSLFVSIRYRGRELGVVESSGGFVKARGSSYVDATLQLDGVEFLMDFFSLVEDLSKGVIPFETVTEVGGDLGLLVFHVPIKATVSCEVYVNTNNQTIERQNCYPEIGLQLIKLKWWEA